MNIKFCKIDVQAGGMCVNSELVKVEMLVSTEILYVSLLCQISMEFEQSAIRC